MEEEKRSPVAGLSNEEVAERIREGKTNAAIDVKTKSVGRILADNLMTLFNLVNFALAILVILVGSYKNATFIAIITCNILIGTIQELRAKHTINKLSLLSAPRSRVVRGGETCEIRAEELVLDDVTLLRAGNQICADCIVIEGTCEADEALLTGESDPIIKRKDSELLSGSFVVSGECYARVHRVGKEGYAARITAGAKQIKKPNSQIMRSLNMIIKVVSMGLIPIGAALFLKQYFLLSEPLERSVTSTVAALIGMIPEGLILLTSVVLAVGVIRLSRHNTLVQELYCIETLARVDMLCLDKTGTITEGRMNVHAVETLWDGMSADNALGCLVSALNDENPTFTAIREYIHEVPECKCVSKVPFSSARKWSGAHFEKEGSLVLGACEFVFKSRLSKEWTDKLDAYAEQGARVLVIAHSDQPFDGWELPENMTPIGIVAVQDVIRKEAPDTLRFFAEQGVTIKVISGDNPITVSQVALRAGLSDAKNYVDATTLKDDDIPRAALKYTVFGRVSPHQKQLLVKALKSAGHTVAMTGDGVNDVLALKDADCSIAIASGSDAARNVSQLVLLDSNFSSLYNVVMEGRRAINNIQRSASLFLVKTIFSFILSLCFVFIPSPYPFVPIQLTLISALLIGAPSFVLALEPNRDRIAGSFISNVLKKAFPGGLAVAISILLLTVITPIVGMTEEQSSTLALVITGAAGFIVLYKVSAPFNALRLALFVAMLAGFVLSAILFGPLFQIVPFTVKMTVTVIILATLLPLEFKLGFSCVDTVFHKLTKNSNGIIGKIVKSSTTSREKK